MSYDLVVFDTAEAPQQRGEFLAWYERQQDDGDSIEETDCLQLRAFFEQIAATYLPLDDADVSDDTGSPITVYSFGPHSIYMAFSWSQADVARRDVIAAAQAHGVGFYDISSSDPTVWFPPKDGQFGVFYCFYATGDELGPELPAPMDTSEILTLIPRLEFDRDFFGIVDHAGTTLQFMYHGDENRVWMEIPEPEVRGSYGAYVAHERLLSVLQALPKRFAAASFPELRFEKW